MKQATDLETALWRGALEWVVSPPSLKEGLNGIARLIVEQFAVDSCAIYLYQQQAEADQEEFLRHILHHYFLRLTMVRD